MKILAQFNNSQNGNDYYIRDEWIKVEVLGRIAYLWARENSDYKHPVVEVGETSMVLGYPEIKAKLDA